MLDIVMISFPYRPPAVGLGVVEGTQNGTHPRNQERARRATDHHLEWLHRSGHRPRAGRRRTLATVPGCCIWPIGLGYGTGDDHRHFRSAVRRRAAFLVGPLHAAAERSRHPAVVRQLPGHDAGSGAARHQSVLYPAQGVAARAQFEWRAAEGQRQERQPDRNRGGRGVARRRQCQGKLRCRQLRELRQAAKRGRGAPSRVIVCLRPRRRRARWRPRADAARRERAHFPRAGH